MKNKIIFIENIEELITILKKAIDSDEIIEDFDNNKPKKFAKYFGYKIKNKIYYMHIDFIYNNIINNENVPNIPDIWNFHADQLTNWIKDNGDKFEKLMKLKGFW